MNNFGLDKLTELCEEDEIDVRGGTSLIGDLSSLVIRDPSVLALFPGLKRNKEPQFQVTTTRTPDGSGVSISAVVQS